MTVIGTILLPIVIYTVYEISSISEGEVVIEKVYRDQLDAVIFSVNQFSNDLMSSILDKLESQLDDSLHLSGEEPIISYSNFHALLFTDLTTRKFNAEILSKDLQSLTAINWAELQDSLTSAQPHIKNQLLRYKEGGYRKIEPKGTLFLSNEKFQIIHVILEHNNHQIFCTGLLSINGFANNALAPRLQQIAENELILTMGYEDPEEYVYMTDSLRKEVMLKKSMWLFPELQVGISSKNKTVKELVDDRLYNNLGAALILIILLIFGFTLVLRNFLKEMNLAQTKSDFVSNVSHELRTPLSLISMFAETLYLDRVPNQEKRKEYEEIILKETNRLTNIVNKILNFSQIENNKRTYHPQPVDLNDLLKELLHDYAYHMERNGFVVTNHLEPNIPPVEVDKEALYEALVNLLDNAMKYSESHKELRFSTGKRDTAVYIEVEDHGIGIASEKVKQIFDKFYRITEGNLQNTRGAGLGLALVNHLVDAHGGDIEVESTPGKGSIFRLIFYFDKNGQNLNSRR